MTKELIKYKHPLPDGTTKYLVPDILVHFNCHKCLWRCTKDCPYWTKEQPDILPDDDICKKRIDWLLSFSRPYTVKPTHSQLMLDLHKAMGTDRMLKEQRRLERYEAKLAKYELDGKKGDHVDKLRKDVRIWRANWAWLFNKITVLEHEQVKLDTPKKVEVQHKRQMTPEEFVNTINDSIIDITNKVKEVKDAKDR